MKLLDHILLGQDFGKSSTNTLNAATKLAEVFKSKITSIYVLPDDIASEKAKGLLEEAAKSKLNDTFNTLKEHGVDVKEPLLKYGSTSDVITKAAVDIQANIIVLGAGNATEDSKFRLGTTTERIIQKSDKPVFIIKENTPLTVTQILCPVDFSSTSKRALTNAILICKKFKAELTILSVCDVDTTSWLMSREALEDENDSRCQKHKERFDHFLKEFNLAGVNWTKDIRRGNPAEEILSAIWQKKSDLLVMGTTGKTGLNRILLGSVAQKVIREVPCSLLALKSEDAFKLELDTNIKDLEQAYHMGVKLMENHFYDEAVAQFKSCLNINSMHIPAYFELAKAYDKLNEPNLSKAYRDKGNDIKEQLWHTKIEDEVRKLRGS
ncbi:universal stress protein [Winogradskyella helgolandensis]|uniref:universal stress protein n=1 Tax=Winogradskyella helgolandensis TaxID=2697010 RepID=UPI0015CBF5B1|nr:universal stress protein [Winogradskyella helgolandensis]